MKNRGKQGRSKKTISTILEAATQVIIEEGYDRVTTNRIAERAGFSIGTLYQYFDDKADVYQELVVRELANIENAIAACKPADDLAGTLDAVLAAATQAVSGHEGEIQTLSPIIVSRFRNLLDASRERVVAKLELLLAAHREDILVQDLNFAARVLIGATEGFASSTRPEGFPSPEFHAHIHRMMLSYLTMPELPSAIASPS